MQKSKLENILKYGIYLAAIMPLIIFSQFISPFHFGKVVMFRALVEILLVFYISLVLIDRNYLPKPTKIFWAATIFTAVFGITTLTSVSVYQSFWGTLERMGGWFSFFHFWLFFVILTSVFRTRKDWFNLLKISVVVGALSAIYGFLQMTSWSWIIGSGGRERIFGTIGNAALFAGYEIFNFFLALLLVFKPDLSKNQKYLYSSIAVLDLLAIFATVVRGSILGMVVATIIFALIYPSTGAGYRKIRRALFGFLALAIAIEVILIFSHNSNFVQNSSYLKRISDVSPRTYTVDTRLWAWQAGIEGWKDGAKTVVLGWGPENFNIPFSIHFNPKFYNGPGSETLFDRAHNMFVEILVTMGILGFLSYIFIFVVLFGFLIKSLKQSPSKEQRTYSAVLISGLVAYVIHNSFIFDTSANLLMFFVTMGFISWLSMVGSSADVNPKPISSGKVNYGLVFTVGFLLAILVAVSIYNTDVKPSLANYATTRGIVASWNNDQNLAVTKFREAVSYDNVQGEYEARNRFDQYVIENYDQLQPKEAAKQVMLFAIEEVKKNLAFKDDYLPYLYLSRSYITLGKSDSKSPYNDLALQSSEKALQISPTFVRTYYEVGQAYLNKKDYQKAAAAFQKAVTLNPNVGYSYWYLAATELEAGNTDHGLQLVDQALAKGYQLSEADAGRVLQVYIARNNLPKIAGIYESLIVANPTKASYHASLASAYAQLGRIDDAVKQAHLAVQLDPKFETEARAFVAKLGRQW